MAGRRVHARIWSCHDHQKSKQYIIPYIIPDIDVCLISSDRTSISTTKNFSIESFFDIEENNLQ
jgi:hypothetical protein